jgi:hypothetical protein
LLIHRLGGEETQELGELAAVLGILVNTEFQVLAEHFVKLLEVVLVLGNLAEEIHALLDNVLADNFEDLVLLEGSTGDVEREILGVDDALNEVEVFGDDILTVVHDEDATNVELDVVALLLGLKEVEERSKYTVSVDGKRYLKKVRPYRLGMKRMALNSS